MKQPMHNPTLPILPKLIVHGADAVPWPRPSITERIREDRMQALRVAFFVEELSLTPEESALFWPAWNEEEEKLSPR